MRNLSEVIDGYLPSYDTIHNKLMSIPELSTDPYVRQCVSEKVTDLIDGSVEDTLKGEIECIGDCVCELQDIRDKLEDLKDEEDSGSHVCCSLLDILDTLSTLIVELEEERIE